MRSEFMKLKSVNTDFANVRYNVAMLFKRIAIDLGTANTIVYVSGQGVILNEPTVVALDDAEVIAVGKSAYDMLGKTPDNIRVVHPLRSGAIADYVVTEALLRYFIGMAVGKVNLVKPFVLISIPVGATSVESRAVLDATYSAGARQAFLIPEPLAAALGAELPVGEASGNMIVNIGGGTTEIAIVSLYGMVTSGSVRVGGMTLDDVIITNIRRNFGLIIGAPTAEVVKKSLGDALSSKSKTVRTLDVKGRDAITGFPKTITVNSKDIFSWLLPSLTKIAGAIKNVLEQTPPELSADIIDKGIVLSGGTALLSNIDTFISEYTGVAVHIADDPQYCVVRGLAMASDNLENLRKSLIGKN